MTDEQITVINVILTVCGSFGLILCIIKKELDYICGHCFTWIGFLVGVVLSLLIITCLRLFP